MSKEQKIGRLLIFIGIVTFAAYGWYDYTHRVRPQAERVARHERQFPPNCKFVMVNVDRGVGDAFPCKPSSPANGSIQCTVYPYDNGITLVVDCPDFRPDPAMLSKQIVMFETGDKP